MNIPRLLPVLLVSLLIAPAFAQDTPRPLNLKLPPGELPAASSTAAAPADTAPEVDTTTTVATHRDPPGTYYGDTSGSLGDSQANTTMVEDDCDDSTYNQPQVHGSVGMGVMSGRHVSGNYQGGTVNLSQAFGSCDHPTGGISISVGGSTGHFHDRRGR